MPPLLSIIIPAYNEEARLPDSLKKIISFLEVQTYEYEILIVENGSQDRTLEIAQDFERRYPFIRALSEGAGWKGACRSKGNAGSSGNTPLHRRRRLIHAD